MKTLGIIGGAGPMATAYFMEQIISMTKADKDQEHIHMLVDNNPRIPDRTKYILDNSAENPEPVFRAMGENLKANGASVFAIPCITASYFIPELEKDLNIKIVDIIGEVIKYLRQKDIDCVGLMATDGTVSTGIFQTRLEEAGIKVILPDKSDQALIMDTIYGRVKAGLSVNPNQLQRVRDNLALYGAKLSILGCTELSVASMDDPENLGLKNGFLDAMKILAAASILECGAALKEEL